MECTKCAERIDDALEQYGTFNEPECARCWLGDPLPTPLQAGFDADMDLSVPREHQRNLSLEI